MTKSANDARQYTKARFWKCALQVNPAGYLTYRGKKQTMAEKKYNALLLQKCQEEEITVLGMANHGNVDGVDAIRNLMSENGIVVFPGFEIASSEKVHFVCLYPEDVTTTQLDRYLGVLGLLDPEDGVRPSRLSAEQLVAEVERTDGFIFAAHCTDDSGVLKGKFNHIWKLPGLRAAQIPGDIEDLRTGDGQAFYQILRNKTPEYRRERPMALINAKDVERPETIENPKTSCFVKMTRPCFASFKQAFLDPESRIRRNSQLPVKRASAIESIQFVAGYLDGVAIDFSDHLNTVIGGRGTGKSTLLEALRFAFDRAAIGDAAKKQHKRLLEENLGKTKGLVEVKVRSSALNGQVFTVSRRFGERPVVEDSNGEPSTFAPRDLLPALEIFGQNEIYEITQSHKQQLHLLERFVDDEGGKQDTINDLQTKLRDNRRAIGELAEDANEIEAEVEQLPKITEQIKQYTAMGLEKWLKKLPVIEEQRRIAQSLVDLAAELRESYEDSSGDGESEDVGIEKGLPHAKLLGDMQRIYLRAEKTTAEFLGKAAKAAADAEEKIQELQQRLEKSLAAEEAQIQKTFSEIPDNQGKTGEEVGAHYQSLLKKAEKIRPKEKTLKTKQGQLEKLTKQRERLLVQLGKEKSARAARQVQVVKRLNRQLAGKLRLQVTPEGGRHALVQYLLDCGLPGVGKRRLEWLKDSTVSPRYLAQSIRADNFEKQANDWGASKAVVTALSGLDNQNLLELEELNLPDEVVIELNVALQGEKENYRPLQRLSTGQQCTAVLHLLLLDNRDPLVLDQPEDNLDNAFIAERIVAELRSAKTERQFIFATHNANIPVFGDAEWIGVFEASDDSASLPPKNQGAIDLPNIQRLAADILEGGRSAFRQRKEKYGFE